MARILVVDDDPLFLAVMGRALERAEFAVVGVSDGAKALNLIMGEKFDALVCDLILPNPTGLQVIRHARDRFPDLPIVAISGGKSGGKSVHVDVFHVAQTIGATVVIKKPFEVHEFVATVVAAMSGGRQVRASV